MKPEHITGPSHAARRPGDRRGQGRGVMFGPERTGLDNDDVALADAILTFPVNPAYASLNLAQAVLFDRLRMFSRRSRRCTCPFDTSERLAARPRAK